MTVRRPAIVGAAALGLAAVVAAVAIALAGGGSSPAGGHGSSPASIVPADALAYVDVTLDRGRPAVARALKVAARLPDYPLAGGAALTRLSALIAGGATVDYGRQIRPWLGGEVALALLDTTTSTAGSLLALDVSNVARARSFVRGAGATAIGSAQGTTILRYASGNELAFIGHFLVIGQDASVRAAIATAAGSRSALAGDASYRRAIAGEGADRVLDAYASLAGVRRVLADQSGAIGALGSLLYSPALEGVAVAVSPSPAGFAVRIHSALDPSLVDVNAAPDQPFTPTLDGVLPTGASLLLDVSGLDRVAPQVLDAGTSAGVAGDIGPLLRRLGTTLHSEGVDVSDIVSIFHHETAVALVPHGSSPTLVIVARTPDQARTTRELAELEVPLAQLFSPAIKGSQSAPVFNDRTVAGVSAHQLVLAAGLQLDYAVFRGLVVISTSLQGISAVAQHAPTLAADPAFRAVLGARTGQVTSLAYADPAQLLSLGSSTGLTGSRTFSAIEADLKQIGAIGLTSTRGSDQSTSQLQIEVR